MLYDFQYSCFTYWFVLRKVYARKEAQKGGLDKTLSLQKDLSEMHEWMTQAVRRIPREILNIKPQMNYRQQLKR